MATNTTKAKAPRKHPQGDHTIQIARADYKKSGASADRWALLKNGMTVQQYVDACAKLGPKQDKGAADIRWDTDSKRKGGALIRLVAPKAASAQGKAA